MAETDALRECIHCGAALADGQLICNRCGEAQKRSRRVRCRQCGTLNRQSQQECVACGGSLRGYWIRPVLIAASILAGVVLIMVAVIWLRGQGNTPPPVTVPAAPATSEVAAVPTEVFTSTPVPSPTPGNTSVPTRTETPSPTPSPTWTPTHTPSPTPTNTATPTSSPTPTATNTPTTTPSPTATASPTDTASPIATASPTATASPIAAPTETSTPAPSATASPVIHTVAVGDTLYDIAATYGVTVQSIMEANDLTSTRLNVGQQLIIPVATATPEPTPTQS